MPPSSGPTSDRVAGLPELVGSEAELEELLTRPRPVLVQAIRSLKSPLLVLGAGGKMGPTLAVLARRAADAAGHPLEVIAVSRFREAATRAWLENHGVRTLGLDLLDPRAFGELPEAGQVAYLVGVKFGTARDPAPTWAVNTLVPARVIERFPAAPFVALSTGNVYPFADVAGGGAVETDPLTPLGEYANAAVARERIFEWCARATGARGAFLRLSYAVELRYGVLVDLARKVHEGEPIDLGNSHFNCVWQGDANEAVLRAFDLVSHPASAWNLCLPEAFEVRAVAERFGELLGRRPAFRGTPTGTGLLSNAARLCAALGEPSVTLDILLPWVAAWVLAGGRSLGKPTHFESRDGRY